MQNAQITRKCDIIIQKADWSIQAFRDYYTGFCMRWCSRVEFLVSLVWRENICFFIGNIKQFSY